jgi:hypothetical protein
MAVQANRALAAANLGQKQRLHIVNQVTPEAQLPVAVVEKGLGSPIAFQVGYDPGQARAVAHGMPLALTGAQSALPAVARRMAEAIVQSARVTAA